LQIQRIDFELYIYFVLKFIIKLDKNTSSSIFGFRSLLAIADEIIATEDETEGDSTMVKEAIL